MSKIQFEYDKKYNISAKGSLVSITKEYSSDNFSLQIQGLVVLYRELYKLYAKALSNDGRIIGTERGDLLSHNDTFIHLLILMAVFLRGDESLHIISLDQTHHGFMCTITVQYDMWTANGRLAPDMVLSVKSLKTFFDNTLNPRINSFLNRYKEAAADNILQPDEKRDLDLEIKYMLTTAIHMRFLLSHCLINS